MVLFNYISQWCGLYCGHLSPERERVILEVGKVREIRGNSPFPFFFSYPWPLFSCFPISRKEKESMCLTKSFKITKWGVKKWLWLLRIWLPYKCKRQKPLVDSWMHVQILSELAFLKIRHLYLLLSVCFLTFCAPSSATYCALFSYCGFFIILRNKFYESMYIFR